MTEKTIYRVMHVYHPSTPLESTQIALTIRTTRDWPDSHLLALLDLASSKARFESMAVFSTFGEEITKEHVDILDFIHSWNLYLGQGGADPAISYVMAKPKEVIGHPPYSTCPRCGAYVWSTAKPDIDPVLGCPLPLDVTRLECLMEQYQEDPQPIYCLRCGQRYKYDDDDALLYKGKAGIRDVMHTLKADKGYMQPSLDSTLSVSAIEGDKDTGDD